MQAEESPLILGQCGMAEARARATEFTETALSSDPRNFQTLTDLLDGLCLRLSLNLKASEAWITLAETRRRIEEEGG